MPARSLRLQNFQRNGINLARRNARGIAAYATYIVGVNQGRQRGGVIPIGVCQSSERRNTIECSTECVADSLSLVRAEEKQLVFDDRSAKSYAEYISVKRWRAGEERVLCQEGGRSIERIILKIFVSLTMQTVGT